MSDGLFKHSSVMFISIVISNIFAYLFHIFIARELGPASYGEFGSLLAIFMILAVPVGTIQTVIAKYIARFNSKNEPGKIGELIFNSIRKLFFYGLFAFLLITILSPFIASFLKIDSSYPIVIVGLTILASVLLPINRGSLQGLQKFNSLAFNNVLEVVIRLFFGIVLVFMGFGINGALLSFGLGYLFAFLIAFISLKKYFRRRDLNLNTKEIYKFSLPVFFAILFINLITNFPTVLIKHFYSSEFTGLWNVSLTLARIIFFVSSSISLVMFAKVSSIDDINKKKIIFKKSLNYVLFTSLLISFIFFFFSKPILLILFGQKYLGGAIILKWIGFWVSMITFIQLYVNYKIAKKEII